MKAAKVAFPRLPTRNARLAVAAGLAALMAAAPTALAQDPGVVYEPGSPSDKEYAIPLEEVRRDAGGEQPGKVEALAFGIGLSRRDSNRGGAGPGGGDRGGSGRSRSNGGSGRGTEAADPGFTERLADAESAGAPTMWKLGPLLLVLLPALLVGLILARRGRGQAAAT